VIDHPVRNISSVRNAGIRQADFELIVAIDADCIFPPQGLVQVWKYMQNEKHIGAALGLRLITAGFVKGLIANVLIKLVELASGMNGALFCFWKKDALSFGGFRENLLIAEDRAFVQDLKRPSRAASKRPKSSTTGINPSAKRHPAA
jgi:hypothetical protein